MKDILSETGVSTECHGQGSGVMKSVLSLKDPARCIPPSPTRPGCFFDMASIVLRHRKAELGTAKPADEAPDAEAPFRKMESRHV